MIFSYSSAFTGKVKVFFLRKTQNVRKYTALKPSDLKGSIFRKLESKEEKLK